MRLVLDRAGKTTLHRPFVELPPEDSWCTLTAVQNEVRLQHGRSVCRYFEAPSPPLIESTPSRLCAICPSPWLFQPLVASVIHLHFVLAICTALLHQSYSTALLCYRCKLLRIPAAVERLCADPSCCRHMPL